MDYDLYFHNDFDGYASAAVFLDFLNNRGDNITGLFPVDHEIKPRWEKFKFKNPFAVFDFYFHPRATYFFDHHATTFIKESWKKSFRPSKLYFLKPSYFSCCHMVLDSLVKEYKFKPAPNLAELTDWLDVIDGAKYGSGKQAIELKEPALRIDAYVDFAAKNNLDATWIVKELKDKDLRRVAEDRRVVMAYKKALEENKKSLAYYQKNLKVFENISFIDLTKTKVQRLRAAPYYLCPKLAYSITVKRKDHGYRLSVGSNPWHKKKNKIDLGVMLKEFCGGGGHKGAAGAFLNTTKEMNQCLRKIVKVLAKKDFSGFTVK